MPGVLLAAARPRAAVAFHYAAVFSPRELAWYTRFNLLVTGEDIDRKVAAAGYRFQALVFEIVRSLPFQSRRGELSKGARPPRQEKPKEVASR